MNFFVLLISNLTLLGLAFIRTAMDHFFPHLPTVFDYTSNPALYYDFIVAVPPLRDLGIAIGAGCGGSVVASRLSETSASVLLLEAGGSAPQESASPYLSYFSFFSDSDWIYEISPQTNAYLGFVDNKPKMRLGKVMGGSSTINGMIYNRGNKMDYDSWARLGNTGWDYDSILPYFKKSENIYTYGYHVDGKYHGRKGPVNVSRKEVDNDLIKQFLLAGRQLGYKTIDPSGPNQIGFSPAFETLRDGVRSSASESFLGPVVGRPHLQIRTNAMVTRVLFDTKKRAVGVEYFIDGMRRVVLARKEVILSAGAVRSPQLLLLSGVGPREHLEEMGIPVVADIPGVGRNLHEHPGLFIPFTIKEGVVLSLPEVFSVGALREYITGATGPMAKYSSVEGFAWMNLGGEIFPSWPDVQLSLTSTTFASVGADLTAHRFSYRPEIFEDIYGNLSCGKSIAFMAQLARPKSRGSITLKSTNPADNPTININMFDHPDDIKLFVKVIRKSMDIARTPAFRDVLDVRIPDIQLTPCKSHGLDTDAYWECFTRQTAFAGYHLTSAAMMAPPSNPLGVVSPRLSVRGVTGLRIVDSSVMPHNMAGNPMATIYMIGEKGADMIKEDWGYPIEFID